MKPDERALLIAIATNHGKPYGGGYSAKWPEDIAESLGMHPKRAMYLFLKWSSRPNRDDWFSYGVRAGLGWLTPEGFKKATELSREANCTSPKP